MPILKPEPDLFPEDLFTLPPERFPWWVVYVRSRQEKLLARECRSRELPFYLPLCERRSPRDRRGRIAYVPLFTGYLFARGDLEHERLELLKTNLCLQILAVPDQEALAADLAQVRRLQEMGVPLVPWPELTRGSAVRIAEGPFLGMTGRVTKVKGKSRFVVSVRFIHRSVSVELERDALVPADPDRMRRR